MGLLEKIEQYTNRGTDKVSNKTAYSKFIDLGFPSLKNEEWKYTSLKKIIAKEKEILCINVLDGDKVDLIDLIY